MKEVNITTTIKRYAFDELSKSDQELILAAQTATKGSYAPYSRFAVGAAARLNNDVIVSGSNQENAAYPSGICAERTTLFYANSQYPDQPVKTLAVAARTERGFLAEPIPPCGACRQVMLETENRFNHPFRVLLYGEEYIYELQRASDLLPISFIADSMK